MAFKDLYKNIKTKYKVVFLIAVSLITIKQFNVFNINKIIANFGNGSVTYNENHYETKKDKQREKVSQDILDIIRKYNKNQKIIIATTGDSDAISYGKIVEDFLRSKDFINVTNNGLIPIDRGLVGERFYFDKDYNELNIYINKNN
jgi:hypothetical protein